MQKIFTICPVEWKRNNAWRRINHESSQRALEWRENVFPALPTIFLANQKMMMEMTLIFIFPSFPGSEVYRKRNHKSCGHIKDEWAPANGKSSFRLNPFGRMFAGIDKLAIREEPLFGHSLLDSVWWRTLDELLTLFLLVLQSERRELKKGYIIKSSWFRYATWVGPLERFIFICRFPFLLSFFSSYGHQLELDQKWSKAFRIGAF